jgi:sterol desaturase/sphingolipid hydroxylase (fatty acid hydroxylase superfamily)
VSGPDLEQAFAVLRAERSRTRPSIVRRGFSHLFAPAFLFLMLTPWMRWTGGHLAWTASTPASALSAGIVAAMFVAWFFEQVFPAERAWNVRPLSDGLEGLSRLGRDLFYLVAVTWLTARLLGAVEPFVHALAQKAGAGSGALALWPSRAPFALRVALAFLAVELCSYWVHRAAHHSRVLWQFHSTHHVITELNAFKALRTHPLDNLVFYVARVLPLLLVGAGADELAAAVYLGAVLGILSHTNLPLREGPLGLVVNFPRWHSVHHSADLAESRSNFGCHTVLWDRVFGTFRAPRSGPVTLGVEPVGPRTLWQELAWPLYRWVSPDPDRADAAIG